MEYKVKLQVFEGPLDLLLHLIKEQKLDIYDIPIAEVTKHYLEYLDLMETLNLDIAGDYMVMAAELARIKSKMLLPVEETEEEEDGSGPDPRAELVEKLLEYKKYKEAAQEFRALELRQKEIFTRKPDISQFTGEEEEELDVTIFDLLNAFQKVLKTVSYQADYEITYEIMSVAEKMNHITEVLENNTMITFEELFVGAANKMEIVTSFLALLELVKLGVLKVRQLKRTSAINILKVVEEEKEVEAEKA